MSTADDEIECPRCGKTAYLSFENRFAEHVAFCTGSAMPLSSPSRNTSVDDACNFVFDQHIINRDELTDRKTRPIYATHATDPDGTQVTIIWRKKPIDYALPPIKPVDYRLEKKREPSVNKDGSVRIQFTADELRYVGELSQQSALFNQEPGLMADLLFGSPPKDVLPEIIATFDVVRVILDCPHLKVMSLDDERGRHFTPGYRCMSCHKFLRPPPLNRGCGHGEFITLRDGMAIYCADCGIALYEETTDPFAIRWSAHSRTIGDLDYLSRADESSIIPFIVHKSLHGVFDELEEYEASGAIDRGDLRFAYYDFEESRLGSGTA